MTHEPGGTRAGEAIRAIFLDPAVSLDVAAELLLVLADRAQHVREKLSPALAAGEIVISDRYSDSTVAYQGYGRGFDLELLRKLNRLATDGMVPDLTIVLDCRAETGLARTRARVQGRRRTSPTASRARWSSSIAACARAFSPSRSAEPERVTMIDSQQPMKP